MRIAAATELKIQAKVKVFTRAIQDYHPTGGSLAYPHLHEVHLVNTLQGVELTGRAAVQHLAVCF